MLTNAFMHFQPVYIQAQIFKFPLRIHIIDITKKISLNYGSKPAYLRSVKSRFYLDVNSYFTLKIINKHNFSIQYHTIILNSSTYTNSVGLSFVSPSGQTG